MTANCKLPPDFIWQQEGNAHALYLDKRQIARVAPVGKGGWMMETVILEPGIEPQRFAVRTVDLGRGSAARWVLQRMRLIAKACGREVGTPRRSWPSPADPCLAVSKLGASVLTQHLRSKALTRGQRLE
jgi:hypothetical protein